MGISRRGFNRRAALGLSVLPIAEQLLADQTQKSPNERLNLGVIGVNNRGADNLAAVAKENVVVLCDVDLDLLGKAKSAFPKAVAVQDFRKLLDHPKLDAIVVSTPDHMHAIPTAAALRLGMHVYCEKPLAHSVHECRVVRDLATAHKRITQMGTQIHATANYRRVVELIQAGVIGPIKRVQVWNATRPVTGIRVKEGVPPASLDYNLWLGPAPYRPYHQSHLHFHWRWWWDFGGGVLADLACHYIDLPFWALELTHPTSIAAKGQKDHTGDNEVPALMQVDYQFPARGDKPPVHLTWYHGGWKPAGAEKYGMATAILFVGEQGELIADYSRYKLFPEEKFKDIKVPASLPVSPGHQQEWLDSIRSGKLPSCAFEYSGRLSEAVLLGNVSYRAGQKPIEWNADELKVTNNVPGVNELIKREYRAGWTLG